MSKSNDNWSSNFGFLMAAIASAVGLGSIWRFPYLVGSNGGSAFIIMYIILSLVVGVVGLVVEIAIGRNGGSDAVDSFVSIAPKSKALSYVSVITGFLIMTFYSVIGGWILYYLYKSLRFDLGSLTAEHFGLFITSMQPLYWQILFSALTMFVITQGVAAGIERYSKWMNTLLLVLIIAVVIKAISLPGSKAGIDFLLTPDFSIFKNPKVWLVAIGQAFFSLSLGMAIMVTYGCYLPKSVNIARSSLIVALSTLFIALLMGFAIFPALFAMGQSPDKGPGLLFIVLPQVFNAMPAGNIFAILFFLATFFAAITSAISLVEPLVARTMKVLEWPRKKASYLVGLALLAFGAPVALAQGKLSGFTILGADLFDSLDFVTDKVFMPFNALLAAIIAGWFWKNNGFIQEISRHGSLHPFVQQGILWMTRLVVPLIIIVVISTNFYPIIRQWFA